MAVLILPHRWRQQPQGPVEIDWGQPLARGLVFATIPTYQGAMDLIGGQKIATTVTGSARPMAGPSGVGVNSPTTTTSSLGVAYNPTVFRSIATEYTIATTVDIRSFTANSKLVSVPFLSNLWTLPYQSISLGRSSSTDQLITAYGTTAGSAPFSAVFPAGTFVAGNGQRFVVTRATTAATAHVNGVRHDPESSTFDTEAVGYSTGGRVSLLNRNSGTPAEGTDGRLYHAFMWNRALSDSEALSIDREPYQILAPLKARTYFFAPTAPAITGTAAATLPKFGSVASATQTAPQFTATAAATLPAFGATATATRTIPDRAGAVEGLLPKFGAQAEAERTIPGIAGAATGVLPRFGAQAEAVGTIPDRLATALATLPKFGASATGTRLPVPAIGEASATLPLFSTLASSTALVPVFSGVSLAGLPAFGATAEGAAVATQFVADSAATLPSFGSRAAGLRFSPNTADITVVERFTARVNRVEALSARVTRTATLTARMRTP